VTTASLKRRVCASTGLTQAESAGLIGATRESINKALGAFRSQGLVPTQQGYLVIVDPDALRERISPLE
jgi:uncharacterized protein YdbL (DUF1318 family)